MKSPGVLALILIAAILAWFSVVFWVPNLAFYLLERSGKCASLDLSLTACREILSALGATGDVFGAINSLFSGLALFGVAFTLWMETNAKRESRKPLVITYLDSDSVALDRASPLPEPSLRLSVASKVANQTGEPALNVQIFLSLRAGAVSLEVPTRSLQLPLISGGQEESKTEVTMSGAILQAVLTALTRDGGHVRLHVRTRYDSLEGVSWSTCAVYQLSCKLGERRQRLNSLRSRTDDFETLWQNNAAVPLDAEVEAGTWRHSRT